MSKEKIKVDEENRRLIWTVEQKDNFIELIALIRYRLGVIMKGKPYEVRKGVYAWDFTEPLKAGQKVTKQDLGM